MQTMTQPTTRAARGNQPQVYDTTQPSVRVHSDDDEYYYYRNPSQIDTVYGREGGDSAHAIVLGTNVPPRQQQQQQARRRPPQEPFVLTTEMCLNMSACPRCRGQGCSTCQWGKRRASYADYRRDMRDQGEHICHIM